MMSERHRELDRAAAAAAATADDDDDVFLGGPAAAAFLSQPLQPLLGGPLGDHWGAHASQPHAAAGGSKRESLGFIEREMLPMFKSRVASDPLATLNAR
jgi:hypothetical protein